MNFQWINNFSSGEMVVIVLGIIIFGFFIMWLWAWAMSNM